VKYSTAAYNSTHFKPNTTFTAVCSASKTSWKLDEKWHRTKNKHLTEKLKCNCFQ